MSHQKKISKAVICCGGKATRFAPISRTVPKEMFPIGARPVIHYIVQELIDAGITDILMLIGTDRGSLQHYMDCFADSVNVYYRRVPVARGPADNIWHAKSFAKGQHFITAYCDDVFFEGNPTRELIEEFFTSGRPALTVTEVAKQNAHQYGIFDGRQIVEKPAKYIGNLAAVGRYLLPPNIFGLIEQEMRNTREGSPEICFVKQLNKIPDLRAVKTAAKRFDTGTPQGFFEVNKYFTENNGCLGF